MLFLLLLLFEIGKGSKRKRKSKDVEKYKISFSQLMRLNAPEWKFLLIGCVAACLHGATFPIWAVFFGDFFGVSITMRERASQKETVINNKYDSPFRFSPMMMNRLSEMVPTSCPTSSLALVWWLALEPCCKRTCSIRPALR